VKLKLGLITLLVVALTAVAAVAPTAEAASPATGGITVPITSTPTASSTAILTNGQFTVASFQVVNGQLVAVGTLTGTVTDLAGNVIGTINQVITLQVGGGTGSCQILNLTLGPLDLNLLGLMVHLDQVHLTITAQQGPGNLLGNLLCALANLLNGNTSPTALQQLANLLNQILGQV
jgi:hypothetical protein